MKGQPCPDLWKASSAQKPAKYQKCTEDFYRHILQSKQKSLTLNLFVLWRPQNGSLKTWRNHKMFFNNPNLSI